MNWVRGAEIPGTMQGTSWYPLPEPRPSSQFRSHWKLWADGRDYSGNDGGCNQDGRGGGCSIGAGGGPGALPASTYFPGGNHCFRSGSGAATTITTPVTGAHWVFPTVSQNCGLLCNYHNGTHIPMHSVLGTFGPAGLWYVGSYHLTYSHSVLSSGHYPALNTWTWLCWTVDTAYTMRTYVNGALTASGQLAFVPLGSDQDMNIGGNWGNTALTGYMSDVRLYNVALSAAEILEIYQRTTNTLPAAGPAWVPVG